MKLKSLFAGALALTALPMAASALAVQTDFTSPFDFGDANFSLTANGTDGNSFLYNGTGAGSLNTITGNTYNVPGTTADTNPVGGLIDLTEAANFPNFNGFGGNSFEIRVQTLSTDDYGFIELRGNTSLTGKLGITFNDSPGGEFSKLTLYTTATQGLTAVGLLGGPSDESATQVTDQASPFGTQGTFPTYNLPGSGDLSPGNFSIYLTWFTTTGGSFSINFDGDVNNTPVVPVPAGVILLLTGLAGFGFFRGKGAATA